MPASCRSRAGDLNYGEAAVGALRAPRKPTRQAQPEGSNVRLDGHDGDVGPVALPRPRSIRASAP